MFIRRYWITGLVFAGVMSAHTADAESPPDCSDRRVGTAAFQHGNIAVLRPSEAAGAHFIWERASNAGQQFESIAQLDLPLLDGVPLRFDMFPSSHDQVIVLANSELISFGALGLKSAPSTKGHTVIDAQVAFDSTGLASIAYLEMRAGAAGKQVDLHLVQDSSAGASDWTTTDTLTNSECKTSMAVAYDSRDVLWVACSAESGASVYQLEGNRLVQIKRLLTEQAVRIAGAKAGDAVFFLLSDDPDRPVYVASPADDWQLQAAGKPENRGHSLGRLFAPDAQTWVYKADGEAVAHVGVKDGTTWSTERLDTFRAGDRVFDVASDPLRILSGNKTLYYHERTDGHWTAAETILDGLSLEDYNPCGSNPGQDQDQDGSGCHLTGAAPIGTGPWGLVLASSLFLALRRRGRGQPDQLIRPNRYMLRPEGGYGLIRPNSSLSVNS